jgi:DbpA RNA binding domain
VTPLLPELKGGKPQRPTRFDERRPARFDDRGPARFDDRGPARFDDRGPARFDDRGPARFDDRGPARFDDRRPRFDSERPPQAPRGGGDGGDWVPFRVTWGEQHGADARRLVAMLCRRGNIRGSDIGAIRVTRTSSTVEVAGAVARGFAEAAREQDPRDPRVMITPLAEGRDSEPETEAPRPAAQRPRAHVPPSEHRPPRAARSFDSPAPRPHAAAPRPAAKPTAAAPSRPSAASRPAAARPAPSLPRTTTVGKPTADTAPKRPARRVIVDAPPPRRPKKK